MPCSTRFTVSSNSASLPATSVAVIVAPGNVSVNVLVSPSLMPADARFELRQHPALAEDDREVGRLAAGELDAVRLAREIDRHAIAFGGAARSTCS